MDTRTSYDELFIDGRWAPSRSEEATAVVNPATGAAFGRVPRGAVADVEAAVAAARRAFDEGPWPTMSARERSAALLRFADVLESWRDVVEPVIRLESGALPSLIEATHFGIGLARFRYAAEKALTSFDTVTPLQVGPGDVLGASALLHQPIGVVGAITPFNFPLYLNLAKLGPALAMGNTVVLKPSPLTPLEGLVLGAVAAEADLPPGVLNVVTGEGDVGDALVTDPRVDMISFTGSEATGSRVMASASGTLKRVVLELGGKSAMIVREDADVEAAAAAAFGSFTLHAGQGCVLLTRHLVHRAVADQFLAELDRRVRATVVGDPEDPSTTMGPLISAAQREKVLGYIDAGVGDGGTVAARGSDVVSDGFFVPPVVLSDVPATSRSVQEEIFGPVAVVLRFDDDHQAVRLANDSRYGLSSAIFSGNGGAAWRMAQRLRTGGVRINGGGTALDLDAPTTGWKTSGLGTEHGIPGLMEYTLSKTVAFRAGR
ncbi:aldehyde dehydrogenase family protein [Nocardioides sp. BP30]|uniref:aldehyde dehydrogenase family protein n=1 Tax=Nocardioides sp. BP30 TaxID=3036374 RepID=UPI0024692206|nr:aldehyde dehydrogenase family protein [Nocardioides sp. BP30]WGL54143.1 aldehyde dehydrogenase family protein [Nocardioides sp. BP30]